MPEPLDPRAWRRTVRSRILFVALAFAVWGVVIEAQLVHLQVYQRDFLSAEARKQQLQMIDLPARRGDLLDRHGNLLAYSVDADTIYAVPAEVKSPAETIARLCEALDGCPPRERDQLQRRFARRGAFAYVRRRVTTEQARRVMALELPGISLMKEPKRYYPNRELAAHVLGFVGLDDNDRQKGLEGLEALYDSRVRGRDAKVFVERVGGGREFRRVGDPPVPGASLELTIDQYLQHVAERELKAGVEANRALGGSAVIMDPNTGEILAMANEPTFNPNEYNDADPDSRRNRAVQDSYEPGSTFKMITATAGLEERKVTPETMIDTTGNGVLQFGGRVVRDTHGHGVIPFREVIALSSNIGSIKVGWMLGPAGLGRYVEAFGFGTRLSRDFVGAENAGLYWPWQQWTENQALASVAMGYQIGVTPLQMATAASAIANGGELLQPRVVRAFIEGNTRAVVPRKVLRRVASAKTMATLTEMLEGVVDHGTAKMTQIAGYTIAGKTGTSAKLEGSHYSKSDYNASFVGFLPSRTPALTILVRIDTPKAGVTYGGPVAGPIFQRIASEALRYLGVPPSINPPTPVLVRRDAGAEVRVAGPVLPTTIFSPAPAQNGELLLPELRGLGGREALRVLAKLGLSARLNGNGVVLEQDPPAGTPVEPGASCRLALGRAAAPREGVAGGLHP